MSYYASIAFKQIPREQSYSFVEKVVNTMRDKNFMQECLRESYVCTPLYDRQYLIKDWASYYNVIEKLDSYIKDLFSFKVFYCDAVECLCFTMDMSKRFERVHKLFDKIIYFQNSTDQDYSYKEWKGIKVFEDNVEKVKKLDWKGLYNFCLEKGLRYAGDDDSLAEFKEHSNLSYQKRSTVYDLNYGLIEKYIWNNDNALFIKVLNEWGDIYHLRQDFVHWYIETVAPELKKVLGLADRIDA